MTVATIIAIIVVCSYCSFRTTGRLIKRSATNVQSMFNFFCVGIISVLTALPIALIGTALDSTLPLLDAALFGLLAGEVTFFLRAPLNPPATRWR